MRLRFLLFFLCALSLSPDSLLAQIDSAAWSKNATLYNTESRFDRNLPYQVVDTSMKKDEVYHPLYKQYGAFQDLGNIGSAHRNALFTWNKSMGFNYTFNPYEGYFKRPEQTLFYLGKRPYADINYSQGQRELLFFSLKAAVNISPRWNAGGDFDRITSEGFYVNQKTSGFFTRFFTSYFSKNQRYGFLGVYYRNRGINNENGGLVSDSLFETLRGVRKSSSVRLGSSQSRFRNTGLQIKQYFYTGKPQWVQNEEDSSKTIKRSGYFAHTLTLNDERYFFDNPNGDSSFLFPSDRLDSTGIFYDSIQSRTITNKLSYAIWSKENHKHTSFLSFGASYQIIDVQQLAFGEKLQNLWAEAELERLPKTDNNIGFNLYGGYCGLGYNQNDVKLSADLLYKNRLFNLTGGITSQLQQPDYTLANYRSQAFEWSNRFSKVSVLNWRAALSTRTWRHNLTLQFNQFIVGNWVYFDQSMAPIQTSDVLLVNTLNASKTFQLGILYLEHNLWLQNSNRDFVRLPELAGNIRYYLHRSLFKNQLQFDLGTSVYYNTAWYGNAWNPATRAFYLQNDYLIGNYPVMDAFLNVNILTLVFYFKLEHYNMDWINKGFYYTPNHPLPVRTFRFGFRVRLYN